MIIAYKTTNTIQKHVQLKQHNTNEYDNSDVYKLICMGSPLQYIGQTGSSFNIRFNKHIRAIKYSKDRSTYAQHIFIAGHAYGNIQGTMKIIQIPRKGRHTNNLGKYHIFCTQKQNKQMNEVLFGLNNSIFEAIYEYNHYTNQ
jgi:hypothetical protein